MQPNTVILSLEEYNSLNHRIDDLRETNTALVEEIDKYSKNPDAKVIIKTETDDDVNYEFVNTEDIEDKIIGEINGHLNEVEELAKKVEDQNACLHAEIDELDKECREKDSEILDLQMKLDKLTKRNFWERLLNIGK